MRSKALFRSMIALLLSSTLTGCCHDRKPLPPTHPILVQPVADPQCLSSPPTAPPGTRFQACRFGDWGACLTDADLLSLVAYLDEVRHWMATAWVLCGPDSANPATSSGKVAVQPLSDGERIGLDWRAVWLDPDDEVTPVRPASEAREPKPEPPKGEQP
jgi:hypothetical protein